MSPKSVGGLSVQCWRARGKKRGRRCRHYPIELVSVLCHHLGEEDKQRSPLEIGLRLYYMHG